MIGRGKDSTSEEAPNAGCDPGTLRRRDQPRAFGVTDGPGRVTWPGREEYGTEISVFVGPDGRRWAWCAPPADQLNLPADFRVAGLLVRGCTAAGQDFGPVAAVPTALSAGTDRPTRVLLQIVGPELSIVHRPTENAPVQVEWVLINAIFDGLEWPADPAGPARVDKFSFTNGARQWHLQWLPTFSKTDIDDLSNGLVGQPPSATLTTTADDAASLSDVEEEAYAIARLLTLATGSSVSGVKRKIAQGATRPSKRSWSGRASARLTPIETAVSSATARNLATRCAGS